MSTRISAYISDETKAEAERPRPPTRWRVVTTTRPNPPRDQSPPD
jgi:hypothetical protein